MELSYYLDNNYPPEINANMNEVWKIFQARMNFIVKECQKYIHPHYIEFYNEMNLGTLELKNINSIFSFLESNKWKVVWVPGYIPSHYYSLLISKGFFPLSRLVRKKNQIDYSPTPDFIHDIFGHIPLLANEQYSKYLKNISREIVNAPSNEMDRKLYDSELKLSLLYYENKPKNTVEVIEAKNALQKYSDELTKNPSLKILLTRMFLYSIEFGLIGKKSDFFVIGAGILSSYNEFMRIVKKVVDIKEYKLDIIHQNFDYFTSVQSYLYLASDIDGYQKVLNNFVKKYLKNKSEII